jgi:molybdopterin/thiamine biosynthesis adenylyltransferase/rhodanese-related sulfurtransferase
MLTPVELHRYQRQLSLAGFGRPAQEKLRGGSVLVIGAGGLGCPALLYLAAAGLGRITILDPDRVDASNLQRQVLYTDDDIGRPKAEVAAERLRAQNPFVAVTAVTGRFQRDRALAFVRGHDVVVDGSDNFATRYLVNDACVMAGRPFVYAAISGFEGQLSVFNHQGGPTYRCLFPTMPEAAAAPSCAEAGVLGVLPGVLGTWQANEAIKLIAGVGEPLAGKLLLWNALTMKVVTVALAPDPRSRPITDLPADVAPVACAATEWEIDAAGLRALIGAGAVQLLDVREDDERALDAILPSVHLPLGALEDSGDDLAATGLLPGRPTVVYCAHGIRSLRAVAVLRAHHGFADARSLRGGLAAWRRTTGG